MNTLSKALLTLAIAPMISVSAQAMVDMSQASPYVGVKAGQVILDDSGLDDYDNANSIAAVAGVQFTPTVGVEIDYIDTGDADITFAGVDAEYDVSSYGLYGTYKYHFDNSPIYAQARLGVAKVKVNVNVLGSSAQESESGIAGGVGVGYKLTPAVNFEAQFNAINSDADARLWSIGANYKF